MAPLSLDNLAVQAFIVHSAILALKLLSLSFLTGVTRTIRGVFANPEDAKMAKGVVKFGDPAVERVRRAHLNDLENIPAFWILGALYLTTGPSVAWATILFRAFTLGRVIHTIVYAIIPLPQPSRAIAYVIPMLVNLYMGVQIVLYYLSAV